MNTMIKTAGRTVIATTLLSLSLSVAAHDSWSAGFPSKAPHGHPTSPNATAPAEWPESWSERVAQARHPKLATGQGEGRTCEPMLGGKAEAALRLAHGKDC